MKICFLTHTVFMQGGVARVVTTLANELSKYHQVDIICTYNQIPIDYNIYNLNKEKVKIIYKPMQVSFEKKVFRKILKSFNNKTNLLNNKYFNNLFLNRMFPQKVCKDFVDFFTNENYDVVIGVHIYLSMFLGIISKCLTCKTIGWQHSSFKAYFDTKNKYAWNQEYLFSYCLKKLDEVVVLTDNDKEQYNMCLNIKSIKIYNPNSFKADDVSNLKNKRFLAIGRLVEEKGFDLLIKSFKLFNKKNNEWKLTIIGSGNEYKKLNKLIKQNFLEKFVEIKPFTKDVKKYYLNSSIYLLSSRWEGWGLVWAEAMVCGLPIVAFKLPIVLEIMQNKNIGFLAESENIEEFANCMLKIVSNNERLNIMSKNAISLAENFNIENITEQWMQILNKISCKYKNN